MQIEDIFEFDLKKFHEIEDEIENTCYFLINDVSFAVDHKQYAREVFKEEDVNETVQEYFGKLFKKIREKRTDGTAYKEALENDGEAELNESYPSDLETDTRIQANCKRAYLNMLQLNKTFSMYYNLFTYHFSLYEMYGYPMFRIILKVLLHFDQKEVFYFLKEVCSGGKMLNFYVHLHHLMSTEIDEMVVIELSRYSRVRSSHL
ncbi:hypothetical protein ECANGB1_662 [Enterospora canceri]|uniref:Uncharacterized protein n=1 Tax=Enterospora canceri TaxID=1081671 RepID=A0A1Y1S4A2_9MICR|nr:hypothetical protein ECANGB1_662 [Enterospora canceri]